MIDEALLPDLNRFRNRVELFGGKTVFDEGSLLLHRWEFDPLWSVFRCVKMPLGGVPGDRCPGCDMAVTLTALYHFLGGESPGVITSASLNFLAMNRGQGGEGL